MASTPFPYPGELFQLCAEHDIQNTSRSTAALRSRAFMAWKAGATDSVTFQRRWENARAEPSTVTVPFLSIIGAGDSPVFISQAEE